MSHRRFALVMVAYAAVHALGWLLYVRHAFAMTAPPNMTHSLLVAAVAVWSAEVRK